MPEVGYQVEVAGGYDEAVSRARLALRAEGFSILTEAHVGEMLGSADGGRQYLIMGAWNAADGQTLGDSVGVGVHLPCNVVVQEMGEVAVVAALDPTDTVDVGDPASDRLASSARDALQRAFEHIAAGE